jgi:hypothetical protein
MKKIELKKKSTLAIWSVTLIDGDWYWVFAKSKKDAVLVIFREHYPDLSFREFTETLVSGVRKIKPDEVLLVNNEKEGQVSKTAAEWLVRAVRGPFVSNTYDGW